MLSPLEHINCRIRRQLFSAIGEKQFSAAFLLLLQATGSVLPDQTEEKTMSRLLVLLFCLAFSSVTAAQDLRVATLNAESEETADTLPEKVAETIRGMGPFDLLAVKEVQSTAALKIFADAAAQSNGGRWRYVISESGFNSDRAPDFLGIIYRTDQYRQLDTREIHVIRSRPDGTSLGQADWGLRGALVLRLQHLSSGQQFQIATVHLKCCNEPDIRAHQTGLLAQELNVGAMPTILLGDTNIPIEEPFTAPAGAHVAAFDNIIGAGLTWVAPSNPMKTQCSDDFDSMLDQIFVSAPNAGGATAEIKFPDPVYCLAEKNGYADHRPVVASVPEFFAAVPTPNVWSTQPLSKETPAALEEREFRLQQVQRPGDSVAN